MSPFLSWITLTSISNAFMVDAHIGGGSSRHGTKMATVAAGKIHGITLNANLYLLKQKDDWNTGKTPREENRTGKLQADAVAEVLDVVRRDVGAKLTADSDAKSVINMSWDE
jgi:hypothetical protein